MSGHAHSAFGVAGEWQFDAALFCGEFSLDEARYIFEWRACGRLRKVWRERNRFGDGMAPLVFLSTGARSWGRRSADWESDGRDLEGR